MSIVMVMLAGMAVALIRRRMLAEPAVHGDTPARLVGWAAGLLAAERAEWGQAMVGELGSIDGRCRRWRFAGGCAVAAMVLPAWGRTADVVGVLVAVAVSAFGLSGYVSIRYDGLGSDYANWVGVAVLLAFLVGYVIAAGVLSRQPRVAIPGLAGGLLIAVTWVAATGFSFSQFLTWIVGFWVLLVLLIAAPALVGAAGTLHGGSAAAGRRAARLAGVSAGLGLYLYGVILITVIGTGGQPLSPGQTLSGAVNDTLSNQLTFALVLVPLAVTSVGWAAATVTGRLRYGKPVPVLSVAAGGPVPASDPGPAPFAAGGTVEPGSHPARQHQPASAFPLPIGGWPGGASGTFGASRAFRTEARRRSIYRLLLWATLAAAAILAFVGFLGTH